jgi:hypothetical protein
MRLQGVPYVATRPGVRPRFDRPSVRLAFRRFVDVVQILRFAPIESLGRRPIAVAHSKLFSSQCVEGQRSNDGQNDHLASGET